MSLCRATYGDEDSGIHCQLPAEHDETEHLYRSHPDSPVTTRWPDYRRLLQLWDERAARRGEAAQ